MHFLDLSWTLSAEERASSMKAVRSLGKWRRAPPGLERMIGSIDSEIAECSRETKD